MATGTFVTRQEYRVPYGVPSAVDSTESAIGDPSWRRGSFRDIVHCSATPRLLTTGQKPLTLGLRGGASDQHTKEGNTGVEFPPTFCHLSRTDCPSLVGVGSRRKRLLGLKSLDVYALGFYADGPTARQALKGKSSSADKLCQEILEADVEKTIRIVVTSKLVNYDRFLGSLKESLQPLCEKAGDKDSMPEFERLFEGTEFRKGLELAFTSTKQGSLAARIDNKDIGEVRSPAFTKSFFSLYLGDNPVSPDAKKNIGKGLTALSSSREDADL